MHRAEIDHFAHIWGGQMEPHPPGVVYIAPSPADQLVLAVWGLCKGLMAEVFRGLLSPKLNHWFPNLHPSTHTVYPGIKIPLRFKGPGLEKQATPLASMNLKAVLVHIPTREL